MGGGQEPLTGFRPRINDVATFLHLFKRKIGAGAGAEAIWEFRGETAVGPVICDWVYNEDIFKPLKRV